MTGAGKKYAVIGLGHFGSTLAVELTQKGAEVLAVDQNLERVEEIKDKVTHTVRLDSTEEKAMRAQGFEQFDAVIVGLRDDFENELLTVSILRQLNVKRVIVIASTVTHERILRHLGIQEVVLPSVEAASRLARSLLTEGTMESFSMVDDYQIVEINAPDRMIGTTLRELDTENRWKVRVVTVKRTEVRKIMGVLSRSVERVLGLPSPELEIERSDVLVVFGRRGDIETMLKQTES